MLNKIKPLSEAGFSLIWLKEKTKKPVDAKWTDLPNASFKRLSSTYRDGFNVGVRLGKPSKVAGCFLHAIDVDIRDSAMEKVALERLKALMPRLEVDSLPAVRSGNESGLSRHIFLLSDRPFASRNLAHGARKIVDAAGKTHWDWEIAFLGTGKQAVLPPSIHPDSGRQYQWIRRFDLDALEIGLGPTVDSSVFSDLFDSIDAVGVAKESLGLSEAEIEATLKDLPLDEWCDDRDGWLRVGMALHHETGGSDWGFETWAAFSKQSPDKFDARDQRYTWKRFKDKAHPLRMATLVTAAREARLDAEFENLDESEDLDDADLFDEPKKPSRAQEKLNREQVHKDLGAKAPEWVEKLNRRHAVAFIEGKTVAMTFKASGEVAFGRPSDLHDLYANNRVATERSTEAITQKWMRSKHRRTYPEGIVFDPSGTPDGAFNVWQGFSVNPNPTASCKRILKHIREVICQGEEVQHEYLIGFMAHMVQHPEEKPGVALVLRGAKGAGKDTLLDYLGAIFGKHHVKMTDPRHFTGNFNQHLMHALLAHMEEGHYPADKRAEQVLKSLITSKTIRIEPKGVNSFQVPSLLRLAMSSNEDWVVPATEDERRYAVFDVADTYSEKGSKRKERDAYFDAMYDELKRGGAGALLHHLQNVDLDGFNVRRAPRTSALGAQKLHGLKNVDRWWYERLQEGVIGGAVEDDEAECSWRDEAVTLPRSDLYDDYGGWMRGRKYHGEVLPNFEFGKRIRTLAPEIATKQLRRGPARQWAFVISPLDECRASFEAWINSPVTWVDD